MSCDSEIPLSPKLFEFLAILEDGLWHSVSEIAGEINVDLDRLNKVCDVLAEFESILEREGEKVKLGPLLTRCVQISKG